ncbi:Rossmann-fold NAD(P)-binding domain-containing protein [Nonomuraea phyllanthi]|uniref:hypothetical protein n=1 Tax=Nonomuraea phyllanthi TaxID=2219224 RepID=UPI001D13498B|nr:hypothetical protein [Nonomuraea phyllanthi]
MRVLVMGGTHHVGRAVVEVALRRGDTVTTLNRGLSRPPAPGVEALIADRTDPGAVRRALGDRSWGAVIDTWAWAPRVVGDSARLLAGRAGHYGYVSSRAVYVWPWPAGAGENAPLVAGDPEARTAPAERSTSPGRPGSPSGPCARPWPTPGHGRSAKAIPLLALTLCPLNPAQEQHVLELARSHHAT